MGCILAQVRAGRWVGVAGVLEGPGPAGGAGGVRAREMGARGWSGGALQEQVGLDPSAARVLGGVQFQAGGLGESGGAGGP
ncbi:hypothetical protein GCM10007147_29830 [Nocardiopsis kunsanensis]|uniref:Uncharacterized protein n=1 Tax=Nocardiopsis kunsanensis TaxID=141693 RepID=A0A918XEN0_9ACTN|nr:hypothetical protein GCM10007147_29830 [Nocardiopsis kunsanensis]